MSLSDLASLGSFVSGLAVMISLIYLAVQIRQAERNQKAMIQQGRTARMVAGQDVIGLPSSRGQESRSAVVNMRPLRLHSAGAKPGPAATPDKCRKRHALPNRQPSHQRTVPFPAALPGKTTGLPGGHTGMHARLSGTRQAGTRRQRGLSVAVCGKSTVCTDRAHCPVSIDVARRDGLTWAGSLG